MSIFSAIGGFFGSGAEKPIRAIFEGFDSVITSDEERAAAEITLESIRQQPKLWDFIVTVVDSQHRSLFVSGPRPSLFWVVVICVALCFIPQFAVIAYLWTRECLITHSLVHYPVDIKEMLELLCSAVALYLCRGFEKKKGKS